MAKRLFGTDGIRGVAGVSPLDPATVTALGMALARDLNHRDISGPVLIGMDTRESGPGIAARLAAGLRHEGRELCFAGVVTTPGVAYLARTGGFSAGVMISASHNPFEDNGLKVFAGTGFKLPDDEEHEIEEEIFRILEAGFPPGDAAPLAIDCDTGPYSNFLLSTLRTRLSGLKVVLDCGNGAAFALAPALFRAAGAEVITICDQPNGRNINLNCGALHVEQLRAKVLETHADAGVAFDGDADRAMLIAPSGKLIDGDSVMLITARRMQKESRLRGNIAVSTVMANLGLEKALRRLGIEMVRTPVGDKYVLEEMVRRDASLGGEQSGHMIFREFSTTGDGMLTALQILEITSLEGASLDALSADLTVFPQLLVNVRVREKRPLSEMPAVEDAIRACENELNGSGRVLVRFSGTEPLLRVMVEAEDEEAVRAWAGRIADTIRAEMT